MRRASGPGIRIASEKGPTALPEELLGLLVFREGLLLQEAPPARYITPFQETGTSKVPGGSPYLAPYTLPSCNKQQGRKAVTLEIAQFSLPFPSSLY